MTREHSARVIFDGRLPVEAANDGSLLRFLFSPRDTKVWPYVIRSDFAGLDGQSGEFTAVPPPAERTGGPRWCIPTGGSTIRARLPPTAFTPARKALISGAKSFCSTSPSVCSVARRRLRRNRRQLIQNHTGLILLVSIFLRIRPGLSADEKPRVVVLTDIENEPDGVQSLVRFLTYSNQWDVEALVATMSVH